MKKQVVILADRNYEQYLMMLQLKFVEEKSDEVELVVITDQAYYQEYFSMPRSAGVLIVDSTFCCRFCIYCQKCTERKDKG